MGGTAVTEPQHLYSKSIPPLPLGNVRPVQIFSSCKIKLIIHSPYRPFSLYSVSSPVNCNQILLPVCALQTVQSLRASTVHI